MARPPADSVGATSGPRTLTAVEILVASLRASILDGELAPGTPLREEALSTRHNLGRHTVRAALRQLAADRLVTVLPYQGARVAVLSDDEIRALMQLRIALEGESVRLLTRRVVELEASGIDAAAARSLVLSGVEAANEALRRVCLASPTDDDAIDAAHSAVHRAIVEAADSPRITEAHRQLDAETRLFIARMRPLLGAAEMIRQHDLLVADLLFQGDETIRAHLEASADQLIAARRA